MVSRSAGVLGFILVCHSFMDKVGVRYMVITFWVGGVWIHSDKVYIYSTIKPPVPRLDEDELMLHASDSVYLTSKCNAMQCSQAHTSAASRNTCTRRARPGCRGSIRPGVRPGMTTRRRIPSSRTSRSNLDRWIPRSGLGCQSSLAGRSCIRCEVGRRSFADDEHRVMVGKGFWG